jgi:hypothetical protein
MIMSFLAIDAGLADAFVERELRHAKKQAGARWDPRP